MDQGEDRREPAAAEREAVKSSGNGANPRFDWERLILSDRGPEDPLTRLALLALATFVNRDGNAWPSIPTIAQASALGERATRKHLQKAERDGWIKRVPVKKEGQAWRGYSYALTVPEGAARGTAPSQQAAARGTAPDSTKVRHQEAQGAAPDCTKVRHVVPMNLEVNITRTLPPGRALEPRASVNGNSSHEKRPLRSVFVEEARQAIDARAAKRRQQQDHAPPAPLAVSRAEEDRLLNVFAFAVDAWDEKKYDYLVQALDEVCDELEANSENLAFIDFVAQAAAAIAGSTSWPGASALAAKAGRLRLSCAS